MIKFSVPYPPSVNHYWIRKGYRQFIGSKGLKFREDVGIIVKDLPSFVGEVEISIKVYFPDRRKRDIDNLFKATLDALQHGGMFLDDNLVAKLTIEKSGIEAPGRLELEVKDYHPGLSKKPTSGIK